MPVPRVLGTSLGATLQVASDGASMTRTRFALIMSRTGSVQCLPWQPWSAVGDGYHAPPRRVRATLSREARAVEGLDARRRRVYRILQLAKFPGGLR